MNPLFVPSKLSPLFFAGYAAAFEGVVIRVAICAAAVPVFVKVPFGMLKLAVMIFSFPPVIVHADAVNPVGQ
jgi:hypothetical protein